MSLIDDHVIKDKGDDAFVSYENKIWNAKYPKILNQFITSNVL